MTKIQSSVNLRLVILGVMILCFLIPLSMIQNLIYDRKLTAENAALEISSKWGGNQVVAGPFLVIPYNLKIPVSDQSSKKQSWDYVTHYAYFLPEDVRMKADLQTELRKRGIYEAVLYKSDLNLEGKFKTPALSDFPKDTSYVYWDDAALVLSVSDVKGIGSEVKLNWGGKEKIFLPGGASTGYFGTGLHTPVSWEDSEVNKKFQIRFDLKGSQSFHFVPTGKNSSFQLSADWKDPSFDGNSLPRDRNITEQGFDSTWDSSYFGRNYPQVITYMDGSISESIDSSKNGVKLITPTDHYLKTERSVKYGILILITSFTLFFLMEVFGGVILHPIQYLLIGSAMVVFYILNLSFSEHIGFTGAYTAASIAVSLLIGYYSASVLKNSKKGILTGIYYSGLYGFLYVILSSEDQALLLGSVALFVVLGIVMHFTRKVDWYAFGKPNENSTKN
ncbi:cell envelope integrity protein CreD [Leptospira idonii]|uniref:Cell envelope integrity protein CreD n=1 Tax=Leptospira idonii TaxID=1193500 RepID=A0A4R9M206_9LEPT|nr:cell envelope integrity protein CreD [Leptospira idonii]TGN19319.1 cell envelope integrity protein CreD [Leptospira idonii]